jgi:transposase InsO family protein
VGILPKAPGGSRYLFAGVNTFTKWMEAVPAVNITQHAAVKFQHSIIYRFSVARRVLTDNGTQFKGAKFASFFVEFGIQHQPSSVAHPQMNGRLSEPMDLSCRE